MKKAIVFLLLAACIAMLSSCADPMDPGFNDAAGQAGSAMDGTDFTAGDTADPTAENTVRTDSPAIYPSDPIPDYSMPFPPTLPEKMDLEFWITDDVSGVDFSEHREIDGWFGARQFYGMGYEPILNENGEPCDPEHSVKYLITAFPDYADGGEYVTQIEITDPAVEVYGLTAASTLEEFDRVMTEKGFRRHETDGAEYWHTFTKDGVYFSFLLHPDKTEGELTIWAEVTNRTGIVF